MEVKATMAEPDDLEGFDPATSPLTPERLIGRGFEGFCRGAFGRDSYGEKTIIAFGEHNDTFYLLVEESHLIETAGEWSEQSWLNLASNLSEEEVRDFLAPDSYES